ncbi:hypothetical protein GHK80_07855 [Sinorhizobium medicae]|nr:hypothetical protein [Sinorhizobium medicae]MQX76155.1 hypothetical protein [Sinorhizobium medicae]
MPQLLPDPGSLSFLYAAAQSSQSKIDPLGAHSPYDRIVRRMPMSDALFLAAAIGGFVVLARYARILGRL